MLCTIYTHIPDRAPVDRFDNLRRDIICGHRRQVIIDLADSIARLGLLTPIITIQKQGRLVIVDGRKRIAAIRRLAFEGRLPKSLETVPYILTSEMRAHERHAPVIMTNRALFDDVMTAFREGVSIDMLSLTHKVSRQCIRDVISLSRLSPTVREAFFERLIDFSQAQAFATMPQQGAQLDILKEIGPFASPERIIRAGQAWAGSDEAPIRESEAA